MFLSGRALVRCHARLFSSGTKPKVVVISGPTGTGKTSLSLTLAKELDGEIISADSVQVYKGFDVGSNKIMFNEQDGVPHHLIDVFEMSRTCSTAEFSQMARHKIQEITSRGKVPIVVGGAGYYLRWLLYGGAKVPPPSLEARIAAGVLPPSTAHDPVFLAEVNRVTQEAQARGEQSEAALEALWARIGDPQLIETLIESDEDWEQRMAILKPSEEARRFLDSARESRSLQRVARSLEIVVQLNGEAPKQMTIPHRNQFKDLDYDYRCIYLDAPRYWLKRRLDYRCEQMIQAGLIQEVSRLMAQGFNTSSPPYRAIGYRQMFDFVQDLRSLASMNLDQSVYEADAMRRFEKALLDMQAATRSYAKRQHTWFKNEEIFLWYSLYTPSLTPNMPRKFVQPDKFEISQTEKHRMEQWALKMCQLSHHAYWEKFDSPEIIESQMMRRTRTERDLASYSPWRFLFDDQRAVGKLLYDIHTGDYPVLGRS